MTPRQKAILDMAATCPEVKEVVEFMMAVARLDEKTAILACRAKMPGLADSLERIMPSGEITVLRMMKQIPIASDYGVMRGLKLFTDVVNKAFDTAVGDVPN